ncbi:MAG: hypothetical protein JWM11_4407 [Planctomycetaceae bacterium]|nr:hypothetical protein [Planctomycetaceae bacterium]
MSRFFLRLGFLVIAMTLPSGAQASNLDFESFSDSDALTNQFPGLTFTNTTVLTAGVGLNEFDNPPHSGTNVVFDDGGAITISFATPVSDVGGFFTYSLTSPFRLTLSAFDHDNVLLGASTLSAHSNNQGTVGEPGSSPNEFLELGFNNISAVTFIGDVAGGSFTLDDLRFTPGVAAVPEPGTISLVVLGLGGVLRSRLRRRQVVVDNLAGRECSHSLLL